MASINLNKYAGQETKVRSRHGTMDWLKIGKGVRQGCILSSCLFNLYAEYITWNARLDESQAGIKIAGRNIDKLIYADDPDSGKDWRQEERGTTENEMVGWHHWLNRHDLEQSQGDSEGQEAWCAAVHGVTKSQTWVINWTTTILANHRLFLLIKYK